MTLPVFARQAGEVIEEARKLPVADRYRQLADAMPQIVWTSDTDGNATYYNRRWFEYTGMADGEVDATAWSRVTHPDDLPEAIARRERTLRASFKLQP